MSVLLNPRVPDSADEQGERSRACPYLQRVTPHSWYPIEGYCLADPYGGLRVVTVAEFRELCTQAEHVRCQLYRGRREHALAESDPERREA